MKIADAANPGRASGRATRLNASNLLQPRVIAAASKSGLDIVNIENDRRNYHLWAKKGMDRWQPQREAIIAASDDKTYRLMTLLIAGTAEMFSPDSQRATAYRVTLGQRH